MRYHFTKHAQDKIKLLRSYGFIVNKTCIINTLSHPVKLESRSDETYIATSLYNSDHVIRIVFRRERDILIIITLYPGRKKSYGL